MYLRLAGMSLGSLLSATVAQAACSVTHDDVAVARPLNPATTQADADLIISMSMLPKLMKLDYAAASRKSGCSLGQFASGGTSYELWGDDGPYRQRKAIPTGRKAPVALVMPVTGLAKMLEASKRGKTAEIDGYLLATLTREDFVGWRFYTGMPDEATLRHDMGEALSDGSTPIFRITGGKTSVFVPSP